MGDPMFVNHRPSNSIGLNINDVIEVIGDDLASGGANNNMYSNNNGGGGGNSAHSEAEYSTLSAATTTIDPMLPVKQKAYVRIIEQPQPKALRFRYICEGRSAGSIPGVRSTAENKTFPSIQVVGYTGPAVVVVSCVTNDYPHKPHPHNLVGKDFCKKGVCTMNINNESMQCVFSNLGIQCVKKKDVEGALKTREEIRVDPFQTGFNHRNNPQNIDLNSLRLCFQVFLEGTTTGKFTYPLKPVVSDPIFDKKATSDLLICKLSECTSSVAGGKEIILLCEKVTKEDIAVRFYEFRDGVVTWEALGDFQPADVHKQVAIAFKTPAYKTMTVENPVNVFIQLQRPSDKSYSEPRSFTYHPLDSGRPFLSFKRLKQSYGPFSRILGLDNNSLLGLDECSSRTEEGADDEDLKRKLPSVNIANIKVPARRAVAASTSGGGIVATSKNESVTSDEVRQKMSAALKRRGVSSTSTNALTSPSSGGLQPMKPGTKLSPLWSDVSSNCYSDAEMIEDVLSDSSVNDILSGVGGEGCSVYQDLESTSGGLNANLNTAITNTLNLLNTPGQLDSLLGLTPQTPTFPGSSSSPTTGSDGTAMAPAPADALYGDASYASCYTNLEFVMNRAKQAASDGGGDSLIRGSLFPSVPHKVAQPPQQDPDAGIYGVPSNRPVHATKQELLQYRGFMSSPLQQQQKEVVEMDENDDLLPKTVLDLFV